MDLLDMIRSIDKPHTEDVLHPLSTIWGEHPSLPDALPEYPRPRLVRDSFLSLNGVWHYAITDSDAQPDTPDGRILVPFSPECRLSGVERQLKPDEYLWYFRELPAFPRPAEAARLLLHFGAVDQICEVYVNDTYLCTHVGGYLPFTADITEAIRDPSAPGRLTLRVRDLSQTSYHSRGKQTLERGGMYYTAQSGIWQSVWMEWVPDRFVTQLSVTPHDDLTSITVSLETSAPGSVEVFLLDAEGRPFTRGLCTTSTQPTGENPLLLSRSGSDLAPCNHKSEGFYPAHVRLYIPEAHPWTPEDPYLYRMRVCADDDTIETYFAMRTFGVAPDAQDVMRFTLNGKPFFLHGVLDQGYWPESLMTPPSDKALVYDITRVKYLGFNMIRKHIKIECARWYYHCDRLGMIVWQDMVSGGTSYAKPLTSYLPTLFPGVFTHIHDGPLKYRMLSRADKEGRKQWEQEMRGTIAYLKGTPSIAAWVLFNEGWGQFEANAMTKIARSLDPSRPIDQASGWFDQGGGDFLSVHNYFRKISVLSDKHNRAFIVSEYGGYACHIDGHSSVDRIYGYHKFATTEELEDAYRKLLTQTIFPLIEKGLCGAVYTQVSDIEEEVNGLMTYDRKITKVRPVPLP